MGIRQFLAGRMADRRRPPCEDTPQPELRACPGGKGILLQGQRIRLDDRFDLLVDAFAQGPVTHLFNTPSFFRLHSGTHAPGHYFQLAKRDSDTACATIHFTQSAPRHWRSPARGTFGGFSCAPGTTAEELALLARGVTAHLDAADAAQLSLVLAPSSHDPELHQTSLAVLSGAGFVPQTEDLNQDLVVDDRPLTARMSYGNLKRHRKCMREGIRFEPLAADRHEAAYRLIADNRLRRGYPLTMSWEAIATMRAQFPAELHFFGACSSVQMLASAICIRISPEILYVFYWGDAEGTSTLSPVVVLAAGIYGLCQTQGIRVLDAGISTDQGRLNEGLSTFKRNLGFAESSRLTLARQHPTHA